MLATKEPIYNWYRAHQNLLEKSPPNVKRVSNHLGYIDEHPPYEDVERYDLRFIDTCTVDELFEKYF